MPEARVWTPVADKVILTMRVAGSSWADIGQQLGLSRNTVIERGRRLNAAAPVKPKLLVIERVMEVDPNRAPLPAGHPLTWGLLTNEPYPETEKNHEER